LAYRFVGLTLHKLNIGSNSKIWSCTYGWTKLHKLGQNCLARLTTISSRSIKVRTYVYVYICNILSTTELCSGVLGREEEFYWVGSSYWALSNYTQVFWHHTFTKNLKTLSLCVVSLNYKMFNSSNNVRHKLHLIDLNIFLQMWVSPNLWSILFTFFLS
jgi:hypothetical protein